MVIPGQATVEGTRAITCQHPHIKYVPLGNTQLQVSPIGFGGYRIEQDNGWHEQAIRFALQNGINLIDTSSNYTDGQSERLIGRILLEQIEAGNLQRNNVVIVTKAGYIQGFNYALAQQRKQEGRPFLNVVKCSENMDHCIHPDFLADQLDRSRERLNVETIDGFLLHNPEYYLAWAQRSVIPREEAWKEYYRRIQHAFEYLETAVEQSKIAWYGVSSNTFPLPANHYQHTNLQRLLQCAIEISNTHHFRAIQMPLNLLEPDAALVVNQEEQQTVLQLAKNQQIAVLINRPLNAINENNLTRLADVDFPNYPAPPEDVSTAVDTLLKMENEFQSQILPSAALSNDVVQIIQDNLRIGLMLNGQWGGFGTYQNWLAIRTQFILRRAQSAVELLSNQENLPTSVLDWLDIYIEAVNETLAAITAFYQEKAAKRTSSIKEAAILAEPEWAAGTLSQTAVRALRSTEGVSCVLVGIRQQAYVQDMLVEIERPVEQIDRQEAWIKLSQQNESQL